MSTLRLYYDFSCPWSYLGLVRLQDVADRNARKIDLRPVIVDTILATENPDLQKQRFAENPAKAAWQRKDLDSWAAFWGLTIELDESWPADSRPAAIAAAAAIDLGKGLEFSLQVYRAYFKGHKDICSSAVLTEVAVATGLDEAEFLAKFNDAEAAAQVDTWTEELVRQGGFGTPSVFVDDDLFFGNDRLALVDWMLGPISDEDFVMPGQHDG